ncbi:MAG: hypothetical protein AB7F96_15830 [Beijerinckiaceae bacterium]
MQVDSVAAPQSGKGGETGRPENGGAEKWPPHLLQAKGFRPAPPADAPARKPRRGVRLAMLALACGAGAVGAGAYTNPAAFGLGSARLAAQSSEMQKLVREENNTLNRVLSDLRILQAAYANVQGQVSNLPLRADLETLRANAAKTAKMLAAQRKQAEQAVRDRDAVIKSLSSRLADAEKSHAAQIAALTERLEKLEKARQDRTPVAADNSSQIARSEPPPPAAVPPTSRTRAAGRGGTGRGTGYVLRDVSGGVALVEGRNGELLEVYPGIRLPGAGRVRSINRRGGKWIVVTTLGTIDADPF